MKKFYQFSDTSITSLNQIHNISGGANGNYHLYPNRIYYLTDGDFNNIQANSELTVFGNDAFNMLGNYISVLSIIDSIPAVPTTDSWYLVGTVNSLYDNTVQITLSGTLTAGSVDDWVIAENGATGQITGISGNNYTIRYNGTDFLEAGGSNTIHLGQVYGSGVSATITDEDLIGPFNSELSSFSNHLMYYNSSDTDQPFKFLSPFGGLGITISGTNYTYNLGKWEL